MEHVFTTQDHEDLRQRVREFAERVVRPLIPEMEGSRTALVGLSRLIAQQGWIGATIDPAYGGMGAGHLAKTVIIEELSRVSGAMGAMVQASQLGVAKIIHFGDDSQKRYWLPKIAEERCCRPSRSPSRGRGAMWPAWRAARYGTATTTSSTAARSSSATAMWVTYTVSWSAPVRAPRA